MCWADIDTERRKLGDQMGLDTPVVLAENDGYARANSSTIKIKPRQLLKKSQALFKIKCSPPLNQIRLQKKGKQVQTFGENQKALWPKANTKRPNTHVLHQSCGE
ncbi:hypothetical protein D8674_009915 [Pyrus ussuriensis x Pyrus communis]|uniref:Uncharacterized protein n=1 Tax=Pyrus ussuriensis x Pyrus communis TaxID=2448454 RepID=A0A5N5FMZ0_9ROSA|nr:hypothetical protein D8674_009915 [Pyrus ussuriensis x Pyrus communis]